MRTLLYSRDSIKSLQPMKKVFLLTALMSCCLSIYFLFYFTIELLFSIIVSIMTLLLILIYLLKFENNQKQWLYGEIILCQIMVILIFHLPSYYLSSSRITYKMKKMDESIMKIDTYILGWAFKHGQLSLYLDDNIIIIRFYPLLNFEY